MLPIVLGVDEQYLGTYMPTVLNAHQNIANNDVLIKFSSMIGLPKADVTHLSPAGLVLHGGVIFDVMTCLLDSLSATTFSLNLKINLEGAFDNTTGTMKNDLFQQELLPGMRFTNPGPGLETPAGQPYFIPPWNYPGTECHCFSNADYNLASVDWVLVSLRTGLDSSTVVYKAAAVVLEDGSVDFLQDRYYLGANTGPFYILVEHRNHIGALSQSPVALQNGLLTYDFTTQNSYVPAGGGFGQKQLQSSLWGMYAADGNQVFDLVSYDINSY